MNEILQLKEGIILVAVIIVFILVFQLFGYIDKKSRHSSASDEIKQEDTWNHTDKVIDETVIITPAAAAPKDSVSATSTTNSYYHPLTPDEKRELDQKLQKEEASKKAGW
jgi:hypothetical protein